MEISLETKDGCCEAVNVKYTPIEWLVVVSALKRTNARNDTDMVVLKRLVHEIDDFHDKENEDD